MTNENVDNNLLLMMEKYFNLHQSRGIPKELIFYFLEKQLTEDFGKEATGRYLKLCKASFEIFEEGHKEASRKGMREKFQKSICTIEPMQ